MNIRAEKKIEIKNEKFYPQNKILLFEFFYELRDNWFGILKSKYLMTDILSAFTVFSVALPLNIALAVSCGLPASAGLLAGAIGGGLAAIFGGSALQVTGPAAALNVMVLSINKDFGLVGVFFSCLVIGLIQIILSLLSAGKFIKYVPESVLAGFTTGVGLKLLDNQLPELLGLNYSLVHLIKNLNQPIWLKEISWFAVVCGLFVALFVISCKQFKKFPASFISIVLITALSVHLNWEIERVGAVPAFITSLIFPIVESNKILNLIIATIPLAILASIESLLSAQAVDRISNSKKHHNSNLELFGQGIGNLGSGFVGGMPISGVIVRSTVNVQSGAKTRLSSLFHAILILTSLFYFSEVISSVPLAALAGLLCVVALRLIELTTFWNFIKSNKYEAIAFLVAALGTLSGHLLLGISLGCTIFLIDKWINKKQDTSNENNFKEKNRRAIIHKKAKETISLKPSHLELESEKTSWLNQIRDKASIAASSFVHQKASIIGKVVLGEHVHIAAECSIRADEGSPFYIGSNSNIQDGVVIHALKEKWVAVGEVDWAVYIAENVSVAHQALVHGPCYIGESSFIGFQAVVHDSIIGSRCYVGIGAIVVGVEIPEGRFVPHGMVVDSLDKVEQLACVTDAHMNFNEDVVDVNKGLAAAYRKHNSKNLKSSKYNQIAIKRYKLIDEKF